MCQGLKYASVFEYYIGVWVQVVCTVCVGLKGLECVAVVGVVVYM